MSLSRHIQNYAGFHKHKIQKLCETLNKYLGIHYINYFTIGKSGNHITIMNHVELGEYFCDQKLYLDDSLLLHPNLMPAGTYIWSSLDQKFQDGVLDPFQKKFHIDQGLTIVKPLNHPDYEIEGFSFGASKNYSQFLNLFLNERALIHRACEYYKSEIKTIIGRALNSPVDLASLKGTNFSQGKPHPLYLSSSLRKSFSAEISKKSKSDCRFHFEKLSKREKHCVHLSSEGLTAKQIALELQLSRRTVEHYLDGARNKLGFDSKASLLEWVYQNKIKTLL